MAAYGRMDGFYSPEGLLPVHRDQLRAQRLVTSMGELYPFYYIKFSVIARFFPASTRRDLVWS